MKPKNIIFIPGVILLFIASACGKSPLLNHANAADSATSGLSSPAPAACPLSFPKAGLCASLSWSSGPSAEAMNSFALKFWSVSSATSSGPFSDPAKSVFVKLWMPSMGHGSSPVTVTHKQDSTHTNLTGQFEATNVYFVMPGAWDVHVQLRDGATVSEEAVLAVKL